MIIGALSWIDITDVDQASDGQEALDLVKAADYDLILMDSDIPNMPGIDAVRAIRALGKKVPIIMVATDAQKSGVIEALRAGADNYVVKPFEPATIVRKIQDVLGKGSS